MEVKKDNFIFHLSWANILIECSPETRLNVYDATVAYVKGEEIGELDPLSKMAFMFIKKDIDSDFDKYIKTCERNKENGSKGGRPKKPSGLEKTEGFLENPTKPKKPDNDNDNDNDLLSNSYTEDNCLSVSGSEEPSPTPDSIPWNEIVKFFNDTTKGMLGKLRLPFSDKRKGLVRARVNEYGLETFYDVIRKAAASRFLSGDNRKGWTASFDWIVRPTNFEKIMSGNYDNRNDDNADGFEERRQEARRNATYKPVTWENS